MRVGGRADGQTAAAQRGALAPRAARQLAEARDAVRRWAAQLGGRRWVAQLAVGPSAAGRAVRRCVARELQGRGARLALLLLAYAAVAPLRLSPSQQKR